MRFRYETRAERCARLSEWHRTFCLFPLFLNGTCYWLETVLRRATRIEYFGCDDGWWEIDWEYRKHPEGGPE